MEGDGSKPAPWQPLRKNPKRFVVASNPCVFRANRLRCCAGPPSCPCSLQTASAKCQTLHAKVKKQRMTASALLTPATGSSLTGSLQPVSGRAETPLSNTLFLHPLPPQNTRGECLASFATGDPGVNSPRIRDLASSIQREPGGLSWENKDTLIHIPMLDEPVVGGEVPPFIPVRYGNIFPRRAG